MQTTESTPTTSASTQDKTRQNASQDRSVHPFERAGLGKAPFRITGLEEKRFTPCPGAPSKPGGTCEYCSTGILYCFHIQSADGQDFIVGSECVNKTYDRRLVSRADALLKNHKAEAKRQALMARIANAREILRSNGSALAAEEHPSIEGKTLRDYVEWMLENAGHSGKSAACRIIESYAP